MGWEQFDYKIGQKGEVDHYLKADKDLQDIEDLRFYHQKVVDSCDNILKSLAGRSFHITNVINWEKLRNGIGGV